jgi:hypothetical protein
VATTHGRARGTAGDPTLIRLSHVSLFEGISPERLRWLEARLPVVRWIYGTPRPPGLVARDHLFVVREGRLALFERTASGHQVMIAVLDPAALYSTLGVGAPPGVDALEDVAVSPIRGSAIEKLAAGEPRLARNLAEAFSERVAMLRGDGGRARGDAGGGPVARPRAPARRALRRRDAGRPAPRPGPDARPVGPPGRRGARVGDARVRAAARPR